MPALDSPEMEISSPIEQDRAVILTRGPVLHAPLAQLGFDGAGERDSGETLTLEEVERAHILRVLREAKGQVGGENGAAVRLGLKRTTLNSKMKKLGIERSDFMSSA